ncbi:50S ribosomal protein L10 [Helicovermis profundi]|uniref:Large ribosomal subunit protein uL10 n=1 Tax=Helicovermis profundi TaxID=3065157 RepID=A0AAU9EKK9_9FIRM|nr:50S ribosomal protein L10 [Clostridia bacterium S502]
MSTNLELKKQKVEEIKGKFENAQSAILVDYRGLSVEDANELRKQFREAGVEYKVYKNNFTKLAIKDTKFESLTVELTGPNAIAFGYNDPVVPAKIIKDFAKDHKALELKAGIIEGEYYDIDKIKVIADIPSREVLLAKLLGSFKAPISNFAYLLQNIIDKDNGSEAASAE